MGFKPTLAEADIWMRDYGEHYEYISVYVDDLLVILKKPKPIINTLKNKYKFKLKERVLLILPGMQFLP